MKLRVMASSFAAESWDASYPGAQHPKNVACSERERWPLHCDKETVDASSLVRDMEPLDLTCHRKKKNSAKSCMTSDSYLYSESQCFHGYIAPCDKCQGSEHGYDDRPLDLTSPSLHREDVYYNDPKYVYVSDCDPGYSPLPASSASFQTVTPMGSEWESAPMYSGYGTIKVESNSYEYDCSGDIRTDCQSPFYMTSDPMSWRESPSSNSSFSVEVDEREDSSQDGLDLKNSLNGFKHNGTYSSTGHHNTCPGETSELKHSNSSKDLQKRQRLSKVHYEQMTENERRERHRKLDNIRSQQYRERKKEQQALLISELKMEEDKNKKLSHKLQYLEELSRKARNALSHEFQNLKVN